LVTYSFTDMDPYFRSLGNMIFTENGSELQPVDALRFLMGFHISIPLVRCRTRKLVRG
jgi:hypothetical protein